MTHEEGILGLPQQTLWKCEFLMQYIHFLMEKNLLPFLVLLVIMFFKSLGQVMAVIRWRLFGETRLAKNMIWAHLAAQLHRAQRIHMQLWCPQQGSRLLLLITNHRQQELRVPRPDGPTKCL